MTEPRETDHLHQESTWVAQALSGDPAGFDALVRRYHAPLRRLLRSMLRNPEDADDILQETFLRAHRFLHRFDPRRPFGPWLMRIGVNLARNRLRGRQRAREVSLDEVRDDEDGGPIEGAWLADRTSLEDLDYRALLEATRRALEHLPDDQRVVLEMRLLGEMSYKEIATALRIPIGTVMSRLNRGRRRIQADLAAVRPGGKPEAAASEAP